MVSLSHRLGICLLLPFFAAAASVHADDKKANTDLGKELEAIYLGWKDAIEKKDPKAWVKHSSRFSRVSIRNAIISRKMEFPDAFFDTPIRPPELKGLKFIHAIAVGNTAQAVYFGRADFQLSAEAIDIPNSLLVLRYLKEDDGWKFDSTRLLSLAGMAQLESKIIGGDYSFLDDDIFIPPGEAPPIPKLCPIPEIAGHYSVVSLGYETTVTVNGFPQPTISNTGGSHIILGGLKNGFNKIEFKSRKIPPPVMEDGTRAESMLEVNVFAIRDKGESQESDLLYKHKPKPGDENFVVQVRGDGG